MTVHFIGAGPGAADLITVRGRDLIAACPVCLYAGSIVSPELLKYCPPDARLVDTAPLSLDEIEAEYVAAHEAGQDVARLHSGDLSVWSAVAEQIRRLERLRHPLHADARRAVLRGGGGRARARADHPRSGAVAGADARFGPRVEDAGGRDARRTSARRARRWRSTSRSMRSARSWRSCRRSMGPTARWRWCSARHGRTSGSFAGRLTT